MNLKYRTQNICACHTEYIWTKYWLNIERNGAEYTAVDLKW